MVEAHLLGTIASNDEIGAILNDQRQTTEPDLEKIDVIKP